MLISATGPIGVLLTVVGGIGLLIWIAPYGVRLQMAFARMVIDDTGFGDCWSEIRPGLGQAWAFIGLMVLLGIGFSLVESVLRVAGSAGELLSFLLQVVASIIELAITIAVMRFLTGELGTGEPVEPVSPAPLYGPGADPSSAT